MHRYLLHNGHIRDTGEPLLSPGQVGFMNGWGVFSTIRVSDGVLFAYERHYERMRKDAERLHVPFQVSAAELLAQLLSLVDANHARDATLRVVVMRNRGGAFEGAHISHDAEIVAFTSDLTNWGCGVRLSYMPHARHAASPFAGAKITSWAQNLTWYEEAHQRGFDEYVLLNECGQVSECTSANIFAVYDDVVVTPPIDTSGCLPGVTRAILLEEIRIPGFIIEEREISPSELEASDQVFITSSTRDILPVLEIENQPLEQSAELVACLRDAFVRYRAAYTAARLRVREPLTV